MYEELINKLRKMRDVSTGLSALLPKSGGDVVANLYGEAADAIEELQRINIAMKPKYDLVCVKCAYYAEAKHNKNGFLICPASGMEITAWDFCSYFEPPKEET